MSPPLQWRVHCAPWGAAEVTRPLSLATDLLLRATPAGKIAQEAETAKLAAKAAQEAEQAAQAAKATQGCSKSLLQSRLSSRCLRRLPSRRLLPSMLTSRICGQRQLQQKPAPVSTKLEVPTMTAELDAAAFDAYLETALTRAELPQGPSPVEVKPGCPL